MSEEDAVLSIGIFAILATAAIFYIRSQKEENLVEQLIEEDQLQTQELILDEIDHLVERIQDPDQQRRLQDRKDRDTKEKQERRQQRVDRELQEIQRRIQERRIQERRDRDSKDKHSRQYRRRRIEMDRRYNDLTLLEMLNEYTDLMNMEAELNDDQIIFIDRMVDYMEDFATKEIKDTELLKTMDPREIEYYLKQRERLREKQERINREIYEAQREKDRLSHEIKDLKNLDDDYEQPKSGRRKRLPPSGK